MQFQSTVEYRIVPGWIAYRVGSDGSIWSRWTLGKNGRLADTWKQLNPSCDRDGYRRVDLHSPIETKTRKVCGLVLLAFVGERPRGSEARHLDGNPANDALSNLAWGTPLENHADKRRHGTIANSTRHGKTKLTDYQIEEILELKGIEIQRVVAQRFGVSRGYVGQLWSGNRKRVTVAK